MASGRREDTLKKFFKNTRKGLKKLARRLSIGGDVDYARREALDVRTEATGYLAAFTDEREGLYVGYAAVHEGWFGTSPPTDRPYVFHYHETCAYAAHIAGWAGILIEGLLGVWISVAWLGLPLWAAILVGAGIAVAAARVAEAFTVFLGRFARTPRALETPLVWTIVSLGVVWVLALGTIYLIRTADYELLIHLGWAFGPGLAVFGIVTLLLAGALFAARWLYGWSGRFARDWEELDQLERDAALIKERAERVLKRQSTSFVDKSTPRGQRDGAKHFLLALPLILSLLGQTPLMAQDAYVFPDWTPSVNETERAGALRELSRRVPSLSRTYGVERWHIAGFTDDAFVTIPSVINWPQRLSVECPEPKLGKIQRLLVEAREAAEEEARQRCARLTENERRRLQKAESGAKIKIERALGTPPDSRGNCTALMDLFYRLAHLPEGSLAFIVSDGRNTCQPEQIVIPEPDEEATIILLLVSPADLTEGSRAADFASRRAGILNVAPWIEVLPVWRLSDILDRKTVKARATRP